MSERTFKSELGWCVARSRRNCTTTYDLMGFTHGRTRHDAIENWLAMWSNRAEAKREWRQRRKAGTLLCVQVEMAVWGGW